MDRTFQKFLRSGIDLSPLGVERREENTPYFCTPKGASIFGWAGVDGIHFCFVRGFGGTVFAVSPMNGAPDFVHPLASSFADFLRLLLACGDAAALEQAWMWDDGQFTAFLREVPPTAARQAALSAIAEKMRLTPMPHPWAYIRGLQAAFDYGKIKYTEDPDADPAAVPSAAEWKVFFDGGFWGHHGRGRAGTEIELDRQFDWGGRRWLVPAVYACAKGAVLDLCMRVPAEEIRRFREKRDLDPESDACEDLSPERQLQIEADYPFGFDPILRLTVNGKALQAAHGRTAVFVPGGPDGEMSEAKWVADHYGLDTSCGWLICRFAFPWRGRRPAAIESLVLTMDRQPCRVAGPHFAVRAPGDTFVFAHPVSGTVYTLTVRELDRQTIPQSALGDGRRRYPTQFTAMTYVLSPAPGDDDISVFDCARSDEPVLLAPDTDRFAPKAQNDLACCIGVIGGADGPTMIVTGGEPREDLRAACSALHFAPTDEIEWRIEFRIRRCAPERFLLK